MIQKAIRFAIKAHKDQIRKGTIHPYIEHPIHVGILLAIAGMRQEVVAAGILHDTLEDTETSEADIESEYGHDVLLLVKASSEPDKNLPWTERKQHTIDFLKGESSEVKMIALCDKLSNLMAMEADLKGIGSGFWGRFNAGFEEQKWYFESLVKALDELEGQTLYGAFDETVRRVFETPRT